MLEGGRKKIMDGSVYLFFSPSSKKLGAKKKICSCIYRETAYFRSLLSTIFNIEGAKPELVFRRKITFYFVLE